jgi:membrane-associated phospholipid phosphatase
MLKFSTILIATSLAATPAVASKKTWSDISDVGVVSLMVTSIAVPVFKGDGKGALQAGGSIAAATLITQGLKQAFPEVRPDGSNNNSFPSGHTSAAFASAATLWNRQGQKFGIPAMAIATLVGVARVKADKHFWYDAVAGGAIGLASGFLLTHDRKDRSAAMVPWGDSHGGGVSVAVHF